MASSTTSKIVGHTLFFVGLGLTVAGGMVVTVLLITALVHTGPYRPEGSEFLYGFLGCLAFIAGMLLKWIGDSLLDESSRRKP